MAFEHDAQAALANAAALVNTEPTTETGAERTDSLADLDALNAFLDDWDWSGPRPSTRDELVRVQSLRPRLRSIWLAALPDQVEEINALLAEYRALPRLVQHPPYGWHVHATPDDAPLEARMAVEAAMAFIDLIRAAETSRLRVCDAADCANVLVDLSRNRSKRFCGQSCANKVHAMAYRARKPAST